MNYYERKLSDCRKLSQRQLGARSSLSKETFIDDEDDYGRGFINSSSIVELKIIHCVK